MPSGALRERAEDIFARLAGRNPQGVHSYLMQLRRDGERAVEAFLAAGCPERAVWFAAPVLALLDGGVVPASLDAAAVAEQEADGAEDLVWELYRSGGETKDGFVRYERAAHRAIARTLVKIAAGRRKHGRTA